DTSRVVTILSGHIVGDDAELLHYILRGNELVEIAGRCVGSDTIDEEGTLVPKASSDCVVPKPDRVRPGATRLVGYGVTVSSALRHNAWYQRQHVVHIPAAQRNALYLLLT